MERVVDSNCARPHRGDVSPIPTLSIDRVAEGHFRLIGVMDISTIEVFEQTAERFGEAAGSVTLDLSDVTFVDSMGVGAVVRAALALPGGELVIRGARGNVRRTLVIAGIDGRSGIRLERDA
jgi:stage II sporulation protein AA (anti-sigma F factor antagonist)